MTESTAFPLTAILGTRCGRCPLPTAQGMLELEMARLAAHNIRDVIHAGDGNDAIHYYPVDLSKLEKKDSEELF